MSAPSGDVGTLTPVKVGSGPLFFMTRPLDTSTGRTEIHLVVDPEAGPDPKEFLRVSGAIEVRHRIDRHRLLLRRFRVRGVPPSGLFLLDLESGTGRYLLSGRETQLIQVDGSEILFLEVLKEGQAGYSLGPGPAGREKEMWVLSHPEPRHRLWTCPADGAGAPRELCPDLRVEAVLGIRGDGLWVISAGTPRELWWLSRDGKERTKLLDLDPLWIPALFTREFSPSGRHLALGIAGKDSFFFERDLLILEARTGRKILQVPRVRVSVSMASSQSPDLEFTWLDEERLRFSETKTAAPRNAWTENGCFQWVDLEIRTGRRLAEKKYAEIGLSHEKPSRETLDKKEPPKRWVEGQFERSWTRLYFKGEERPVDVRNDLDNSHPTISPCGRWGTFLSGEENFPLYLVDAQTRQVRRLTSGWCYDLRWMPGVK